MLDADPTRRRMGVPRFFAASAFAASAIACISPEEHATTGTGEDHDARPFMSFPSQVHLSQFGFAAYVATADVHLLCPEDLFCSKTTNFPELSMGLCDD